MTHHTPIVIRANGQIEGIIPHDGKHFSLDQMRGVVGGHIEVVGLSDGRLMVCNEEGKLLGLPFNPAATGLFMRGGRVFYDPIAGDVLVCSPEHLADDDDDEDYEYADEYDSLRELDAEEDGDETQVIDSDTPPDVRPSVGDIDDIPF